ncbi:MAG: hypothetical protein LBK61_09175 [Spirochaetaceae bacterium]|jgi:hypothetical protein|nr:hypothetical protein [Spirochaetaceae bacterium]
MGLLKRIADLTKRQGSRFSANVDADGGLSFAARKMFPAIEKDESILFAIDDSPRCDRERLVVFTDKRICWNLKSAYLNVTVDETRHETSGPCRIDLAQLSGATIFTRENSRATTIYAVSQTVQMEIPLQYKIYGDIIGLYFSEKLLNRRAGYNANRKENTALFKEFVAKRGKSAVKKHAPFKAVTAVWHGANFLVHILLLAASIAGLFFTELAVPKFRIFLLSLFFCLTNALLGKKNSASLLFLLISTTCVIFLLGNFAKILFDANRLFFIYSILALLLNIADFDKIFKQVTGFFAVCAVIIMMLRFF